MDNPTHPPIGLEGAVERLKVAYPEDTEALIMEAKRRSRYSVLLGPLPGAHAAAVGDLTEVGLVSHLADALTASIADREKLEGALRAKMTARVHSERVAADELARQALQHTNGADHG